MSSKVRISLLLISVVKSVIAILRVMIDTGVLVMEERQGRTYYIADRIYVRWSDMVVSTLASALKAVSYRETRFHVAPPLRSMGPQTPVFPSSRTDINGTFSNPN